MTVSEAINYRLSESKAFYSESISMTVSEAMIIDCLSQKHFILSQSQ